MGFESLSPISKSGSICDISDITLLPKSGRLPIKENKIEKSLSKFPNQTQQHLAAFCLLLTTCFVLSSSLNENRIQYFEHQSLYLIPYLNKFF